MQHSNLFLFVDPIRVNVLKMGCQRPDINVILHKAQWEVSRRHLTRLPVHHLQQKPQKTPDLLVTKISPGSLRFLCYLKVGSYLPVQEIVNKLCFLNKKPQIISAPSLPLLKLCWIKLFYSKKSKTKNKNDFHSWKYHKAKWVNSMIWFNTNEFNMKYYYGEHCKSGTMIYLFLSF